MNTSDYDILAPDDIKVNLNHVCLQIYGKAFTIYFKDINIRCSSVRESARTPMKGGASILLFWMADTCFY
jgi:hypothetical protein